jgi:hypothetical protein
MVTQYADRALHAVADSINSATDGVAKVFLTSDAVIFIKNIK